MVLLERSMLELARTIFRRRTTQAASRSRRLITASMSGITWMQATICPRSMSLLNAIRSLRYVYISHPHPIPPCEADTNKKSEMFSGRIHIRERTERQPRHHGRRPELHGLVPERPVPRTSAVRWNYLFHSACFGEKGI